MKEEDGLRVSTKEDSSISSQRSSFIFDSHSQSSPSLINSEEDSLHFGRQMELGRKQQFDVKLLYVANWARIQAQGAYLQSLFLEKLEGRERSIGEAIRYMLQNRPDRDYDMKLSMLYLTYISYHNMRHHERKLSNELDCQQLQLIRTNSEYCNEQMLININYKELQWNNYDKKESILHIIKGRVEGKRKELKIVIDKIGPVLHLVKADDMDGEVKTAVRKMWENNIEDYYNLVSLCTIFESFRKFTITNQVDIQPRVEQLFAAFKS